MASSTSPDVAESSSRRDRAVIAAQACQTCRNRKSKCDEKRPKCGLCVRLGVDCQYREPIPTKKDKTMVHILDTLARLENKVDHISIGAGSSRSSDLIPPQKPHTHPAPPQNLGPKRGLKGAVVLQHYPTELQITYKHTTVPHKIVLWPSIYIHLVNSGIRASSDLEHILEEGTPWLIRHEMAKHPRPLPYDVGLPHFTVNSDLRDQGIASNVVFTTLSIQQIRTLCDAYFDTFNVLSPLLNREDFMNTIVAPLLRDGYGDGDPHAIIALLVFALGHVAIDGVFEQPISVIDGKPSGFRGGTAESPPGLAIFNEARRRTGFVATQNSLENVQIMLLQASFFEAHALHVDFWRCVVGASMACQVLIKCNDIDWQTPRGDLIKRAYWTCMLHEDLYHLDLDLPKTEIHDLEDVVPLPYFHEIHEQDVTDPLVKDSTNSQYHFLAMIALRRLIARINLTLHESTMPSEPPDDYGGPPIHVIRELVRQLESWRSLLPRPLQWSDNDRFDIAPTDPTLRRAAEPLFSLDHGAVPIGHKSNLDIVTAQLRTRFYYARFMLYRPFVYKALHFPEIMTEADSECCALAIRAVCLWPVAMAPPKDKKRLVPHLFAWTQHFLAILLVLCMITVNDCLKTICQRRVSLDEIRQSVALMLDWLRDVRQVDGIAEWSCRILEPLFAGAVI